MEISLFSINFFSFSKPLIMLFSASSLISIAAFFLFVFNGEVVRFFSMPPEEIKRKLLL